MRRLPVLSIVLSTGIVFIVGVFFMRNARGERFIADRVDAPILQDSSRNCTYTDYYWLQHPELWPAEMVINQQAISQQEGRELLESPSSDELTVSVLRSLYLAYLNIYNGADMASIVDTVQDSETWLAGTPDDAMLTNFRQQMGVTLAANLEAFNQGMLGPGLCPDQPGTPTPTGTAAPTEAVTPSPTASGLQLFFENLFGGREPPATATSVPSETSTSTSPPPAYNPPPPQQPTATQPPTPTNTQPPPPTNTQPPPSATSTQPPTATQPPP
ncbi:hypothetical protein EHM76_02050, partial [bacterium]